MKTIRTGLSAIFLLGLLGGLVLLLIALFSSANPSLIAQGTPIIATPTLTGSISPLPTPTLVVPPALVGPPVLLQTSGPLGALRESQGKLISTVKQGENVYTALIDPATGEEQQLADSALINPRVSGHWLVYEDRSTSDSADYSQIKVINRTSGSEMSLGSEETKQKTPDISGNIVVWADWGNRENNTVGIYGHDLSTRETFPIVVEPGLRSIPRISGEWVIYVEWPSENSSGREIAIELRAHSLETGEDFAIGFIPSPLDASWGRYHAIDGDKIAWSKIEADGQQGELHLYDLTTRTDRKLLGLVNGWYSNLSISASSGIIVFPGDSGTAVDWFQPVPTLINFELPPPIRSEASWGSDFRVVGNHLIWLVTLNPEGSQAQLFVAQITR